MKTERKIGFIDRILSFLPEIHLIGYNYCGPNTQLESRLALNVPCINELDCACKEHDIAYSQCSEIEWCCQADKMLILKAFRRVYAKDSRIGERFAALIVSGAMTVKLIFAKIEICIKNIIKRITSK